MDCPKCGAQMLKGKKGWVCEECGERLSSQSDVAEEAAVVHSMDTAAAATALANGRYAVTETLGKGGMGVVYRAIDTQLKRIVAIKGILPEMLGVSAAEKRFLREAQAVASLDHPNVIRIHDYFAEGDLLYIVMEFFQGVSLQDYVEQAGTPDDAKLRGIFAQITSALSLVHAKGLVHRDLKPSNILIDPQGHVKLIDFGLVRGEGTLVTKTGAYLGTPGYTAPEQEMDAASADARADIYSLGGVLYFCVTGGKHPPRVLLPEAIPPAHRHIVTKCLAGNRDERFATIGELRAALGIQDEQEAEAPLPEPPPVAQAAPPTPPQAPLPPLPVPRSTLFTDAMDRRAWDVNYMLLWFLGVVTAWLYPIVRMARGLRVLNARIQRDFREAFGREPHLHWPNTTFVLAIIWVILGIFLAAIGTSLATAYEFRFISRYDIDFGTCIAVLLIGCGVFYTGVLFYLFCWLRALEKSEDAILDVCVAALREATGGQRSIGARRSARWGWLWLGYVFVFLTGWLFGITLWFGGILLLVVALRLHARAADQAHRELRAALAAARGA